MNIYLIGNAHLDPVWLWQWREGFSEIKATFQSALDRMDEFDDFIFTCASACFYQWIEKNEPVMFEKIKKRVAEGRWEIVGGWFIQPDCNIPSGESFSRHGLYSQRYFYEKFGLIAKTGYNVDSFGHNGNLPQILKKSGLEYYTFMRPGPHEKEICSDLFKWKSQDGTEILAYRIPYSYTTRCKDTEHIEKVYNLAEENNLESMAFYGVGNHGGGATILALNEIHQMELFKNNELHFATTEDYFEAIENKDVPIVEGDLQYHGKGCYTAYTKIKKYNRKCENMLYFAEEISSIGKIMMDIKYPAIKLYKAWKNTLFNQFHDILAGCCIPEAYEDASYLYGETLSITSQIINFAAQTISWNINTVGENDVIPYKNGIAGKYWDYHEIGTPVVVFNPLAWDVKIPVQIKCIAKRVTDKTGIEQEFQIVRASRTSESDKNDTLFMAEVPAMGYTTYHIIQLEEELCKRRKYDLPQNSLSMENRWVKVEFDSKTGAIKRFYDKKTNKNVCINGAKGILVNEENADTWGHDTRERIEFKTSLTHFDEIIGEFGRPEIKLIESGPIRTTMQVKTYYEQSILTQYFMLYANDCKLYVKAKVDFYEKHKMLKLSFDTDLDNSQAYCEIPFGYKKIDKDGSEQVGQRWVTLFNEDRGITIVNDCKYGFDISGNKINISIMRGAIYADHWGQRDEFCEYMDQGRHEFTYTISKFVNFEQCTKEAYELNAPSMDVIESFHKGTLPKEMKTCEVSEKNIMISAFKRSENDDGYILRCYECGGKDTEMTISILPLNKKIDLKFKHNEIKTILLTDSNEIKEVDILERRI